ncbi:ArsR family transcriptional regulator [Candidatus Thorarchaeota archaeon]|nr:MAG: ArsR family transcriptional regulator [Candidatus Thorarchaeota archaeon]
MGLVMHPEENRQDLEEEVFQTLSHQIRRDILRVIGESKGATFTEIKNKTGIEESASLSYHLRELGTLLIHEEDQYKLSDLGKDAYSLLNKVTTYSSSSAALGIIKQRVRSTIIANALLWASALAYLIVVESPLEFLTLSVFTSLFVVSNIILYSIMQYTKYQ